MATIDNQAPLTQAKRVTLIGAVANLFLAVSKLIVGTLSHSHALVADGIHSLSDLLTDALVLITAHYGGQAADAEHPYGHKRIETLGAIVLAIVLLLVACGIMVDALKHIFVDPDNIQPGVTALIMAAISVGVNEWLFQITNRVGLRINSAVLKANAWHHRSDAASSLVVVVGLIGALFGWLFMDAVAAILVALLIFKMGVSIATKGVRELIDTSVEPDVVKQIETLISNIPGVEECHECRTRLTGGNIMVDVHVIVNSKISVSEGHRIGEQVEKELFEHIDHMHDVVVHIDPEDDEHCAPCQHLPLRQEVLDTLETCLGVDSERVFLEQTTLHYLSGKISIGLVADIDRFDSAADRNEFITDVNKAVLPIDTINEIQVFFQSIHQPEG